VPFDGLDKSGTIRRISQSIAYFFDRVVQALIKTDVHIGRPNSLPQLLPRDHLPGAVNQQRKHSKRLALQLDLDACLVQFARFQVELKYAEVNNIGGRTRALHGWVMSKPYVIAKKLDQELHKQVSRYSDAAKESAT
jgi:hypothetical protein